jgi:NAD(P)-dependent dehydrogenase (short-subunit alcohol dehydrogenase family)
MPTYVITGASRGIGLEFVRKLSEDSENIVIGLVRNKQAANEKLQRALLSRYHFIEADVTDRRSLQLAVEQIRAISPTVDVLINNAGLVAEISAYTSLSDQSLEPAVLEQELLSTFRVNVLGVINTTNAILPLLAESKVKKVIAISSGLADDSLTNGYDLYEAAPYSISKAALNTAIAKYSAKHKPEGILFMALSPGVVDTGKSDDGERYPFLSSSYSRKHAGALDQAL